MRFGQGNPVRCVVLGPSDLDLGPRYRNPSLSGRDLRVPGGRAACFPSCRFRGRLGRQVRRPAIDKRWPTCACRDACSTGEIGVANPRRGRGRPRRVNPGLRYMWGRFRGADRGIGRLFGTHGGKSYRVWSRFGGLAAGGHGHDVRPGRKRGCGLGAALGRRQLGGGRQPRVALPIRPERFARGVLALNGWRVRPDVESCESRGFGGARQPFADNGLRSFRDAIRKG